MAWRRGRAYGQDLRERVLAAADLSLRAAAARFAVSPSYVSKVRARVAAGADATLAELRAWVLAEHGVRVSQPVLWKTLARMGLTLRKTAARGGAGPRRRGRGAPRLGRQRPAAGPGQVGVPR